VAGETRLVIIDPRQIHQGFKSVVPAYASGRCPANTLEGYDVHRCSNRQAALTNRL